METKSVKISAAEIDSNKIQEAASLVDAGKLVAFPTETVYGIACRVKADSLKRLDEVKGRGSEKYYTLHIGQKDAVKRYVPAIGLRAQKLIERCWPGPLTIVFELDDADIEKQRKNIENEVFENLYVDNSIGIRCPDEPIALALLQRTNNPVVAPSANITGRPPAVTAEEVLEQFAGQIELILDGGPCRYKKSSSVVKIGKRGLEVIREGVYCPAELEAKSTVKFLFVCTGNTCRSPMAKGMFSKYLAEKLGCEVDRLVEKGYKVYSAGTMGIIGSAASSGAISACAAKGIDINNHRSMALSRQNIEESDFIFVMGRMHCEYVAALSPAAVDKCKLLAGKEEIPDPIGQEQQIYDRCAELIETAVKERIDELVI